MSKLRRNFERFIYNNRNKGIPNLMLYIAIGNLLIYLTTLLNPNNALFYKLLVFDRTAILQGQVWRLFTYTFTYMCDAGLIWGAIGLLLYYNFGKILEQYWGVLRFNLYYLAGLLLTDIAALLLDGYATSYYINLSIFLAIATLQPDMMIRIYFIIPVKMKWLAWLDLGLTALGIIQGVSWMVETLGSGFVYLDWLLPIVSILNYFLFFGKDIMNVMPDFIRYAHRDPARKTKKAKPNANWANGYRSAAGERPYRFKCTVCGRTDTQYPGLEFRYCSQCDGYRCYCADHINNHAHIKE